MEVIDERNGCARVQRETEHDVQPVHVEEREHAERDVVGVTRRPGCDCICSMFASSEPCVSIAGFGAPAVPAVKSRTARSAASFGAKSGRGEVTARSSTTTTGIAASAARRPRRARSACARMREGEHRLDRVELAGELVRRGPDVERYGDGARGERAEIRGDEGGVVPRDDHDPVAGRVAGGHRRRDRRRRAASAVGDGSGPARAMRSGSDSAVASNPRRGSRSRPRPATTEARRTDKETRPEAATTGLRKKPTRPRAAGGTGRNRGPAAVADVFGAGWEATLRGHPGCPEATTRPHPRPEPRSPARRPEGRRIAGLSQPPVGVRSAIAVRKVTTPDARFLSESPTLRGHEQASAEVEDELGQRGNEDEHQQQHEHEARSPPHGARPGPRG